MQEEYMDYYTKFDEEKRLLSENITRIEFDTTVNVLESYLESAGHLRGLGAATGRYSLHYARQGMGVTALELVPELVEQLKYNAETQNLDLAVHEANATNVHFIENGTHVLSNNLPAKNLYLKCAFDVIGEMSDCYRIEGEFVYETTITLCTNITHSKRLLNE